MKVGRPRLIFAETLLEAERLHAAGSSWADAARALTISPEMLRAARARLRGGETFPSKNGVSSGVPAAPEQVPEVTP